MNKKPKPCVVDICGVPPSAYVLLEDGRKSIYMARLRRQLAIQLATYAKPDGTSIRPSRFTLAKQLEVSVRTLCRLLADLEKLGYLDKKGIHGFTHARERALRMEKILPPAPQTTGPDTPVPPQVTGPHTTSTRPDTTERKPDSGITRPDSMAFKHSGELGFTNTHTQTNAAATPLAASACVDNSLSTMLRYCESEMQASSLKRGEKEQLAELVVNHGWEKCVAAAYLYWYAQPDANFFAKTTYKWTAFLIAPAAWMDKITPGILRKLAQDRYEATPEGAAAVKAQLDACVKEQMKAEAAKWDATPKQNGTLLEELFVDADELLKP